jgi:hypothetical protein
MRTVVGNVKNQAHLTLRLVPMAMLRGRVLDEYGEGVRDARLMLYVPLVVGFGALPDVVPGSYTVVAVEDAWGFDWSKPTLLARYAEHGQTLTIGELIQGAVHLPEPVEVQPR